MKSIVCHIHKIFNNQYILKVSCLSGSTSDCKCRKVVTSTSTRGELRFFSLMTSRIAALSSSTLHSLKNWVVSGKAVKHLVMYEKQRDAKKNHKTKKIMHRILSSY